MDIKKFFKEKFSIKNSEDNSRRIFCLFGIKFKIKKAEYYNLNQEVPKNSVLVVSHVLNYSGAPIVLLPLIEFLQKKGKNVTVLSMQGGELCEYLKQKNVKVLLINIFKQQKEFINFARKFDFVICNTMTTSPFVFLLNKFKIKHLWWLHESIHVEENIKKISKINGIDKPLDVLREEDEVYSVSQYAAESFIKKYAKNVNILPYGIWDNKDIYKSEDTEKFVITSISTNIDKRKAQDVLINALKLLPEEYKDKIQVDIIGMFEDEFAKNLYNAAATLPFVNFKGKVYFKDKSELYKNTNLFVCPSRDDPFPVVVSEAMSFSIPCIVSDKVGQAFLIKDGYNGFVIKNEDIEGLKNKIIWCVDNKEKLIEIGKNSRTIYENHASIETFEKNLENILRNKGIL